MNHPIQVYALGHAIVDIEMNVTDQDLQRLSIDKGARTMVDEARQSELLDLLQERLISSHQKSGGSACNSLYAAANFGAKTYFGGLVADDPSGDVFINDLKDVGIEHPHNAVQPGAVTGKCLVMITPDSERTMNTFVGVGGDVSNEQLDDDVLKTTEWAYLEGYLVTAEVSKQATIRLRDRVKAQGGKVAMTFSDPAMVRFFRDGLLEMLDGGVDLLFSNQEEALSFTQTESMSEAVERMKRYAKTFAITCGSEGALVFDGERLLTIAPHSVTPIDSNGAGDMFAGAFLYALTQGHNFEQAGNLASLAASKVVSQYGPRLSPEQHAEIKAAVFS